MKSNSVLIVGYGDLGARVSPLLQARGCAVTGVRRDLSKMPAGVCGHAADYVVPGSLDFMSELRPDYVLTTFTPTDRTVEGYQAGFVAATTNVLAGLGSHRPRRVLAVSSTRVFAEQRGGWVDERSPLSTTDPRAQAMLEAEQLLLDSGHQASVVRFAGIYGSPGGRLMARILRGDLCSAQPSRFSNRIHRDDCAGFLAHLLQLADAGESLAPVFIGVDDEPALQYDVESWLARQLGVVVHAGSVAAPGHAAAGHKRCRNRQLRDSGYQLIYPDYRVGYKAVIANFR